MNSDWYEKFEEYLQGNMSREERSLFEAALSSNEELSSEFMVYRTIETEMRNDIKHKAQKIALENSLQALNARYFKSNQGQNAKVFQLFPNRLYKITAAIAASILVMLIAYALFLQPGQNTQRLASNYFNTHLEQLSQTMDASQDSLQLGIAAYNNKEYSKALQYFQGLYSHHPDNTEAKKNLGLVYLATKEYDKALQQFDELAKLKHLHSNSGLFLKAVTLMQRNQEGDEQKAEQLLQQVVAEKAEGSQVAEEWLKKF